CEIGSYSQFRAMRKDLCRDLCRPGGGASRTTAFLALTWASARLSHRGDARSRDHHMSVLVTGAAGFIGYHVARRLVARGEDVIGIDNLNSYYDPALKRARLAELERAGPGRLRFHKLDFADADALEAALADADCDRIVHLGAQAGVRYSLQNPRAYAASNLVGHLNMLELARHRRARHLVYASSSSVYGGN